MHCLQFSLHSLQAFLHSKVNLLVLWGDYSHIFVVRKFSVIKVLYNMLNNVSCLSVKTCCMCSFESPEEEDLFVYLM